MLLHSFGRFDIFMIDTMNVNCSNILLHLFFMSTPYFHIPVCAVLKNTLMMGNERMYFSEWNFSPVCSYTHLRLDLTPPRVT